MTSTTGYSRLQIWLHWLIALMIVFLMFVQGDMDAALAAAGRGQLYGDLGVKLHIYVGNAVLALVALRLGLRYFGGTPAMPVTSLIARAAILVHWALYALMVLVPLSGIVGWYGGIDLAVEAHEAIFNVLLLLALLHAVAALFHHYVLKDATMRRMMRPD